MKQLKKVAIIGMSVLAAAAVPAVAIAANNKADVTTSYVMSETVASTLDTDTKDKSAEAPVDYEVANNITTTDDRQSLNNYTSEHEKFLTWIIAGSAAILTMLVACVLLMHKIKKVNELNHSIELQREFLENN